MGLLTPNDYQMPLNIQISLLVCHRKISGGSWGLLGNLLATSGQCGNYSLATFIVTGTMCWDSRADFTVLAHPVLCYL